MDDLDRIARAHVTLDRDPQVRAGPPDLGEPLDQVRHVPESGERPAGHAWAADFEDGRADRPALTDDGAGDVDPGRREVLAEDAGRDVTAELRRPPRGVLTRVGV